MAEAGNWDSGLGFAPNKFLDVVIASAASQAVQAAADFSAKSLRIGGVDAASNGRVTLALSQGAIVLPGSVFNHGTLLAEPNSRLTIDGGLDNQGLVCARAAPAKSF